MTINPTSLLADLTVCGALVPIAGAEPSVKSSTRLDYVALAHVALRFVPLDLSGLAASRIESLRTRESRRDVEVIVHRGMVVTGDVALLPEALFHLIDNAWAASTLSRSAWIEIGTRMASDGERQFYVADNGAGFDLALAGTLFEPPMSRYREDTCGGHGKGLARAARIIRRHAGRLQGDSSPGMGAEFYFTVGTTPPSGGALDA
jgi:light-regulated signal transduction histidine kinase (bacteriophytochrome)